MRDLFVHWSHFLSYIYHTLMLSMPFLPKLEIYTVNHFPPALQLSRNKNFSWNIGRELKTSTNAPPLKHFHQRSGWSRKKVQEIYSPSWRTQTQIFPIMVRGFTNIPFYRWVRQTNSSINPKSVIMIGSS